MRIFDASEVHSLLDPAALVEAVAAALIDLSAGRASAPHRIAASTGSGLLAAMVGSVPSLQVLAAKLVSVFPGNEGTSLPTHQAIVVAFDPRTGEPLALLDGAAITAHRTAAASALATRSLARGDARVLAILGTGVQAGSHARYVAREREFREIRIGSRDPARAREFADRLRAGTGGTVVACASYEEAISGADVICATTHAGEPAVRAEWLARGAHVNSVGFGATGREVAPETFRGALVAVESRDAAFAAMPVGANDLREAVAAGFFAGAADAVELGELAGGTRTGRTSAAQISIYKSVGVAVEDAAAARVILDRARLRRA